MIDCPNAEMRDRLPDLANDMLPENVRVVVLAHLADCAACSAEMALIREMRIAIVSATPSVDVARIAGALPRADARRSAPRSWGTWRIAAAITVLAVGAGSYVTLGHNNGRVPDSVVAIAADSGVGLAMTGSLADLSDGELDALIDRIDDIQALPSTDVEPATLSFSRVPDLELPDSIIPDLEDM